MGSKEDTDEGNAFKHLTKYLAWFSFKNSLQSAMMRLYLCYYYFKMKQNIDEIKKQLGKINFVSTNQHFFCILRTSNS